MAIISLSSFAEDFVGQSAAPKDVQLRLLQYFINNGVGTLNPDGYAIDGNIDLKNTEIMNLDTWVAQPYVAGSYVKYEFDTDYFAYYCHTDAEAGDDPFSDTGVNIIGDHWVYLWTFNDFLIDGGWEAIGVTGNTLTVPIYGNGYTISHMHIYGPDTNSGLFGFIANGAIIDNIILENIYVRLTGATSVGGGLVRLAQSAIIRDCTVSGTIINAAGTSTGGICGSAQFSSSIDNCINYANITNTTYNSGGCFGGIVGQNLAGNAAGDANRITISNCKNYGNIISASDFVGGICGQNQGVVETSANFGNITGLTRVGGCFGMSNHSIYNCYSTGNVTSSTTTTNMGTGGFCGRFHGYSAGVSIKIENCYCTGAVTCDISTKNGPFVGQNGNYDTQTQTPGTITSCYYNSDTCIVAKNYGLFGDWLDLEIGTNKTTEEMKLPSTFTDWDFDTIWSINSYNDGYPWLIIFGKYYFNQDILDQLILQRNSFDNGNNYLQGNKILTIPVSSNKNSQAFLISLS